MIEPSQIDTAGVTRSPIWFCLITARSAQKSADYCDAQDYNDDAQCRSNCALVPARRKQNKTTRQKCSCQNYRRVEDLHGLVYRRVNVRSRLALIQLGGDDRGGIRAPWCILTLLEGLLRYRDSGGRLWLICQVTAHAKAFWRAVVRRSNPVGDRSSRFGHIRQAVLSTDGRIGNSLCDSRNADCQSCYSRKFVKGVHFNLLRTGSNVGIRQLIEISIIKIDHTISDAIARVPPTSSVFDFALAAFKKIDWLGVLVAEAVSQCGDRNSAREKPAPVRHRETNMLSRVRINNRGPSRVTNDHHGTPQRFFSAPQKYLFHRQRAIDTKRAANGKLYFRSADFDPKKIRSLRGLIETKRVDVSPARAFRSPLIGRRPLAPADALEIAGAA